MYSHRNDVGYTHQHGVKHRSEMYCNVPPLNSLMCAASETANVLNKTHQAETEDVLAHGNYRFQTVYKLYKHEGETKRGA